MTDLPDTIGNIPDFFEQLPPLPDHLQMTPMASESQFVQLTRVFRTESGVRAEFRQNAMAMITPDGTTAYQDEQTYTLPTSALLERIARIEETMIASATRSAWEDCRFLEELLERQKTATPDEQRKIERFLEEFENPDREEPLPP